MSDSSRTIGRIYKESAWGETPSTGNKMTDINFTSENLKQNTNTTRSNNITSSPNTKSIERVGVGVAGDIGVEMNFGGALDLMLAAMLRGTFTSDVNISGSTFAAVASGNTITDSGNGLGGITVGQFIKVAGFTTAANNGFFRVTAVAAGTITVEGGTLVDESAGDSVTISGSFCVNGTTEHSFLAEIERNDITKYKYFTGLEFEQGNFQITPGSLVTGSFTTRGKQMFTASATQGDGSPTGAVVTRSMNSVDNIQNVFKDAAASTLDITNFTFNINQNMRDKPAIGNLTTTGIGAGTIVGTVTLEAYLEDYTLLEEYLNFTTGKLALAIQDNLGNAYVFDFPTATPVDGEDPTGGLNQDVIQRIQYEISLNDLITGSVGITRFAA